MHDYANDDFKCCVKLMETSINFPNMLLCKFLKWLVNLRLKQGVFIGIYFPKMAVVQDHSLFDEIN
jgi:hypothetical protein